MPDEIIVEVAAGVLVEAIGATGRWIAAEFSWPKAKRDRDLEIAGWFDTYTLSDSLPALPDLPSSVPIDRLEQVLRS